MQSREYKPETGGTFEYLGTPVDVELIKTELTESGYGWVSETEGMGTLGPYDFAEDAANGAKKWLDQHRG